MYVVWRVSISLGAGPAAREGFLRSELAQETDDL